MTAHWFRSAAFCAVLGLSAAAARAQDADSPRDPRAECAGAYERAQEHRASGELTLARADLAVCQQADCPAFIRSDCAGWSKDVETAQPSVIFSAKRGAQNLKDVRVSSGNRILAEQLEGQRVELDPGSYDFRFDTNGSKPIVQHVTIEAGEKGHLVAVEFPPPAEESVVGPTTQLPPPLPAQQTLQRESPSPLPWALAAVGAASVGAGVGLSMWARREELQLREECSPTCSDASVRQVRTKYLLADVSFGVGLGSLAAAAYLFVRNHNSTGSSTTTAPVHVVAATNGMLVTYGSRF